MLEEKKAAVYAADALRRAGLEPTTLGNFSL
jgi:hypothetical protein